MVNVGSSPSSGRLTRQRVNAKSFLFVEPTFGFQMSDMMRQWGWCAALEWRYTGRRLRSGTHITAGTLETIRWGDYDAACWQPSNPWGTTAPGVWNINVFQPTNLRVLIILRARYGSRPEGHQGTPKHIHPKDGTHKMKLAQFTLQESSGWF